MNGDLLQPIVYRVLLGRLNSVGAVLECGDCMERVEMENWRFLRGEDLTGVYDVGYAGLGGVYGRNRESCELSIIHSSFFVQQKRSTKRRQQQHIDHNTHR